MTFADGDLCTPATIFPYATAGTAAQNLGNGLIVDGPPLIGRVSAQAAGDIEWNNGTQETGYVQASLRYVTAAAAATVSAFRGKMVRLAGASQEFTGLCVSVFAVEAATTGKTADGAVVTSEVVVLRTRAGQFVMALATNAEVVSGQ